MKRIHLFRAAGSWHARYTNAPDVVAAFGTDTIPTAFTDRAAPLVVFEEILRLNPGCNVSIDRS